MCLLLSAIYACSIDYADLTGATKQANIIAPDVTTPLVSSVLTSQKQQQQFDRSSTAATTVYACLML
jgi:hypothetical protein